MGTFRYATAVAGQMSRLVLDKKGGYRRTRVGAPEERGSVFCEGATLRFRNNDERLPTNYSDYLASRTGAMGGADDVVAYEIVGKHDTNRG